jgi:hypothetical protein
MPFFNLRYAHTFVPSKAGQGSHAVVQAWNFGGKEPIGIGSQRLFDGYDSPGRTPAGDAIQIGTEPQTHTLPARKTASGQAAMLFLSEAPPPAHELGGDAHPIGTLPGRAHGEDMPNGHQESARNGEGCHILRHAAGETPELSLPEGRVAGGTPGGFDRHPAPFAAFRPW